MRIKDARQTFLGVWLRRAMEDLPANDYLALSYYERWARGAEQLLVEKQVLSVEEIDRKMAALEATWGVS